MIEARLRRLNPLAPIHRAQRSNVPLDAILGPRLLRPGPDRRAGAGVPEPGPRRGRPRARRATATHDHHHDHDHHDHDHGHDTRQRHDDDIKGVSLRLDRPLDGDKVTGWLNELLQAQGPDILRAKGILDVKGEDRRLVFQAVHMILEGDLQRAMARRRGPLQPHGVHRPQPGRGQAARRLRGDGGLNGLQLRRLRHRRPVRQTPPGHLRARRRHGALRGRDRGRGPSRRRGAVRLRPSLGRGHPHRRRRRPGGLDPGFGRRTGRRDQGPLDRLHRRQRRERPDRLRRGQGAARQGRQGPQVRARLPARALAGRPDLRAQGPAHRRGHLRRGRPVVRPHRRAEAPGADLGRQPRGRGLVARRPLHRLLHAGGPAARLAPGRTPRTCRWAAIRPR